MAKKKGDKKDEKKDKSARKKDLASLAELAPVLTQAARSLRTTLSQELAQAGLYAGQDGVILQLSQAPGLTPGQLAQQLAVKAPTMTRTIGRMEAQGFVQRKADSADGRLIKVYLTPTGQDSVQAIQQALADSGAAALRDFSDKEIRTLIKLLKALDRNLHGQVTGDDED
ncbi:DNA-binding MarR family transcriptional regulator [Neorhizobium galegae]|uniref:MarR family winged helix-turn-helix transcriptional regulator n=1 Tax=Neorhizobium galegae TaxID=399 RepID=UPI001AEA7EB6|nr:MarR family transcriptional regulator [Neorhizobium galegae]MBP2550008.1 DNA-binding MarR family transcriptional regulator [Neorhizobium galegae]